MGYNRGMMKTKRLRICWRCGKAIECNFPVKFPRKGHKVKCPDCGVIEIWGDGWLINRPHPDPAYNEVVGKELSRLIPKAERRWGWQRRRIIVWWVNGLRVVYGKAYAWSGRIELGIKTIPRAEDVVPIIRHELAHLITVDVFGFDVRGHGKEWKKVARSLGGSGKRCECF